MQWWRREACSQAGWWVAKTELALNANGAGIWSVYKHTHRDTQYTHRKVVRFPRSRRGADRQRECV